MFEDERTELLEKIEDYVARKRYADLRDLLLPLEAADIAQLFADLEEKARRVPGDAAKLAESHKTVVQKGQNAGGRDQHGQQSPRVHTDSGHSKEYNCSQYQQRPPGLLPVHWLGKGS